MAGARDEIIESSVPARLDRLPWSRWHWTIVIALGITWLLDGLETTLGGALVGILKDPRTLHLSDSDIGVSATVYLAGAVTGALLFSEVVMVGVAAFIGKRADQWGRKPIFLTAFAFLAVRNFATVASHNQGYLISLQTLDGVAAAIYGVLLTLVVADLAKGTGRFNFMQGAVQSAMGFGGFLSNALFGWIAKSMGFNASFVGLGIAAVCGGALYWSRMPETVEGKNSNADGH
jgi:MFS family permease